MKWAVLLLSQLCRGTTTWQRLKCVLEANSHASQIYTRGGLLLLGWREKVNPFNYLSFLTLKVDTEQAVWKCRQQMYTLFHLFSPNHLQSHVWFYITKLYTESNWSSSTGQRGLSEFSSSPVSLWCSIQNSPSVSDETQHPPDSPLYGCYFLFSV